MGKIVVGVVWFNEEQLFVYDYWQYWCNIEDVDVECFLKLFIILLMDEIKCLVVFEGLEVNEVKKIFVIEVIVFIYGCEKVLVVVEIVCKVFEEGQFVVGFFIVEIV